LFCQPHARSVIGFKRPIVTWWSFQLANRKFLTRAKMSMIASIHPQIKSSLNCRCNIKSRLNVQIYTSSMLLSVI
jgi:hypothetical protein